MWHEIQILGTVGRDPELRYTADGKSSCSFSVASNRRLPNGNQETIWFKVTAWDKMAENINQYCKKGMKVHVTGRLVCTPEGTPRMYQKKDGTTAASFEVVAKEFRIVDFRTGNDNQQYQPRQAVPVQQKPAQQQPVQSSYTDDIPW